MVHLSRRHFVGSSLAACATLPACGVFGAGSGKLRVAVCGVRTQGRRHLLVLSRQPDVEIVALVDPDSRVLLQSGAIASAAGHRPVLATDPRPVLARGDLDCVVVATPDHWHAFLAAAALTSGKHVFVETPAVHSFEEAQWVRNVARRANRVAHVGLRSRGQAAVRDAVRYVHEGGVGRVQDVRCVLYRYRPPIGRVPQPVAVPPQVDFDVWRGPSPRVPLRRARLHGDWRFDWNSGSGEVGEAGGELLDIAAWALVGCGRRSLPDRIWTCGGRVAFRDDGETPNTLTAILDFDGIPVTFEQRNLPSGLRTRRMDHERGLQYGVVIAGTGGQVVISPARAAAAAFGRQGQLLAEFRGAANPILAFLESLRGRDPAHASLVAGCRASDLGQLVTTCHRAAPHTPRLESLRRCSPDARLIEAFDRFDQHLGRNGYDVDNEPVQVSGWQRVDTETGEFRENPRANALRRRTYEAPFRLAL